MMPSGVSSLTYLGTDKLELLRVARWFVNDYIRHTEDHPDWTLSYHMDCFFDILATFDWDLVKNSDEHLDADWVDDNRE